MKTEQPTPEQLGKFWKWCGCYQDNLGFWHYPNDETGYVRYPELDLNNLFKYAVPKLFKDSQGGIEFRYYPRMLRCILTTECEAGFDETQTESKTFDPALALFWAIWEVINGS